MTQVVISSHIPDVVDAYISTRAQRLALEKQAALLKEQEDILNSHIISHFRSNGMTALGGKVGMVKMKETDEPDVKDWLAIREYIRKYEAWELLHQRLGSNAVKERWAAGEEVPGVGHKPVFKLSVSGV